MIANGGKAVAEGANMPTTIEGIDLFTDAGVLFAPGKAANAGGAATPGLEMAQNAARLSCWKADEADARLRHIMLDIHQSCVEYGGKASRRSMCVGRTLRASSQWQMPCWRRACCKPECHLKDNEFSQ
nr:hypothetical protein [Rahnella perminowiae]